MVRIIIDDREKSKVRNYLDVLGADIVIQRMDVGDVQVSHDCAFELKIKDFLKSVVGESGDKLDVLSKCRDLGEAYAKPALLIGQSLKSLLGERRIHENAILAVIQACCWVRCPVRFLDNEEIVANYIFETAKKEQGEGVSKAFSPHGKRSQLSPDIQKLYTLKSVNDVGPQQAENLLKHFGSIKRIANAEMEELMEVPLVGEQTAKVLIENLSGYYFGRR